MTVGCVFTGAEGDPSLAVLADGTFVGADGEPPLAVLTDGTFMLTEGVPDDSTLAALVAVDTVTMTELSLTTFEVKVTVCVLV